MEALKEFINHISHPPILFSAAILVFFFIFPVNDWFLKWNLRLRLDRLWTVGGGVAMFLVVTAFFAFGMTDANFQTIVLKPDNVPIVALVYLTLFFLWFTQKQARDNDHRILAGQPPNEHADPREKVLVWPDLVYIELIALVLVSVLLIVWSLGLKAPLEEPANPTFSPNPSKAPWYFLGLQEMLVYFDPWIAGVVLPTIMVLGLMSFPFLDNNPRGQGYYCFRERKMAVSLFLFCWLLLWIFLIITGTFLRGPNWNLFGPFEAWDIHKLVPLNNINLSEYVFMIWLKTGVPESVLVREIWGILIILFYFLLLPPLLAKTVLRKLHAQLGNLRYSVFIVLVLVLLGVPIKMYLRWIFNLKYIVAIPEYFFNI